MDSLHPDDMYVSTITIAEMLTGVLRLSDGRRRETIEARVRRIVEQFGPTYPSFTREAAEIYAELAARHPLLDAFDGQIAAIARSHLAGIATRNVNDFRLFNVELFNPWEA